ncbi:MULTISPECIES: hypothetical protein [Sphingomonas]|uniref:Uncharacterized protein n=1 Tax=Sphingomonas molluscorum TaxID=418184 RepID=A0ABU8Q8K7_9SPHN|nr:hypothetical protein [Sphingomonas sp. JUb134]MBM7407393.1 hypothetical protein [Sphingomonas sp. JUb134]
MTTWRRPLAVLLPWVALTASAVPSSQRRTCIDTGEIATREPLGLQSLAFTLVGGRRVTLLTQGACAHLDEIGRRYLLEFEHREGRKLCAGDRLRAVDPLLLGTGGAVGTPFCRVATITPAS